MVNVANGTRRSGCYIKGHHVVDARGFDEHLRLIPSAANHPHFSELLAAHIKAQGARYRQSLESTQYGLTFSTASNYSELYLYPVMGPNLTAEEMANFLVLRLSLFE